MDFENLFDKFYKEANSRSEIKKSRFKGESSIVVGAESRDSYELVLQGPQSEFILQEVIRKQFGKSGYNSTPIGTHPDFIHLESSDELVKQYSCTMFVDIKGSTRLSLLYDLEQVFLFKNAVIQTCVEVVRAFDGCVHRLMGDAVMSFFGSKEKSKEDAIADAVNCAATLRVILEKSIKPWMSANQFDDKDFGFRVGLDFGNDDQVLWGNFGYSTVAEVSATGLPIDMASKLQGLASKNQTMLGQGLLEHIEWPDYYSKEKEQVRKNEDGTEFTVKVPYVKPNITCSEGKPINYRMKEFDFKKFMEVSALPDKVRSEINNNIRLNPAIRFDCYVIDDDGRKKYISASRYLEKDLSLVFEVSANKNSRLLFPLQVKFTKTNHGQFVPDNKSGIPLPSKPYTLSKKSSNQFSQGNSPYSTVSHLESTSYRGLHTMKCEVKDKNGNTVFTDWIGVMIK
ncbi:adenylate/guanylate cyclase domain-containing protein [Vibrio parahaemolyticus]|uniref:Adenylate/guanylate cyclase domain-containing protein n=2 Tax=Vibrio harveyi group TaxID=717610 RepID=A0AA46UNB8_VIBPH|nr:adenylate/guanylate cyclase domain-containing protein [Vibrio parahaemolyticus]MCC3848994.1 adenylate/guanylate cyclase domain-containing protein [Vibrio parahaemolyticus]UYV28623.1 adenylate/guanylate cyclase domain-containing protein [Vibrio parahaemolyticus]HCJ4875904.1 adenylate/guanylate cyclase domain-containing protein [Vibrio parahaemolyticus]